MPSKKPPKPKADKFTILRDTSEKTGYIFSPSKYCAGTIERNLYTGDYSMEGYYDEKIVCVERKGSVAELAGNLTNKEKWEDFEDELCRLESFRFPFLVLEFSLAQLRAFPIGSGIPKSRWKRMRIRGPYLEKLLCAIELKYKTRVVFAGNPECAKDYVLCLFKRVVELCPRV